jgi:serine/threonine-protein kinase
MEGRTKVTKDILAEEGRFILANVLAEGRFSRQNRVEDIRRICENAVTLPFLEYIGFLESGGYLRRDDDTEALEVTSEGARVANGDNLGEFAERAVTYFKGRRKGRGKEPVRTKDTERVSKSSGGQSNASVGGEIRTHGEIVDARYEKLAKIGSGGIGTVYRARQVPLNREVALKEIRDLFGYFSDDQRDEISRRFTDVVQAAAQLAHPNILPMHDVNLDREFPYVVTELAPNGSARRLITDAEDLPVQLVLKYLLQTSHALQAAHSQRVFHRGLKPENLLIDAYGNVKVSDFGFARIVERDTAVIRQVYVGIGSVAYMAPELFTDPVGAGPQADIYALGIIFYELLTRRLPGRRSQMPSKVNSQLPKEIDDIFDKMTRDSRSERYASVEDILDDFENVKNLGEILDKQTQVMAAENPLENIKFRESAEPKETPLSEDEAEPEAEKSEGGRAKRSTRRPFSFQQRKKKS